jgi:ADP-ribose pyrophosphatase
LPEFRRVGERIVHRGHHVSFSVGEFEGPDGTRFERDLVRHPGVVAVLPLHDDDTVTLVRQYRAALDRVIWEIPAGVRDVAGEPEDETARRELAEEAGLRAARVERLTAFHNAPGLSDELVAVFVATGLEAVPRDLQGIEEQHMTCERLPLRDALAMVADGRITDAKTVIALLTVERRAP